MSKEKSNVILGTILMISLIVSVLIVTAQAAEAKVKNNATTVQKTQKLSNLAIKMLILRPTMDVKQAQHYAQLFIKMGKKHKVSADLMAAIAYQESTYNLNTVRHIEGLSFVNGKYVRTKIGSDFCMMQINSGNIVRMKLDTVRLLKDPAYCIETGARILADLKQRHGKKEMDWWSRYNAVTREFRDTYRGHVQRHLLKMSPNMILKSDFTQLAQN